MGMECLLADVDGARRCRAQERRDYWKFIAFWPISFDGCGSWGGGCRKRHGEVKCLCMLWRGRRRNVDDEEA